MLAANESKTKFIMFGSHKEKPIRVGRAQINESESEELLGFSYNKSLTWKHQLANMERELRKRVGILRRLSWHLPRSILTKMIEPIFTSKLRYGIALICNCFNMDDVATRKLNTLHRAAMKAGALGADNILLMKSY